MKDFSEVYTLDESVVPVEAYSNGMLETYGQDLEKVKQINKSNPKKVWTIIDSEITDDVIVVAGARFCGRIAYLITNEEWQSEDEVYIDR